VVTQTERDRDQTVARDGRALQKPVAGPGPKRLHSPSRAATKGHGRSANPDLVPDSPVSRMLRDAVAGRAGKGAERVMSEIKLKKGEPVDRALRRLKKKVDRENTLRDVRMKRHFEKPSERRRRKLKASKFSAMLAARYADL
jgi:small subunit ribosomal protein S21